MAIIINFNKTTSENDMDDLKILLEDIRARFHFSWFVQGNQENNQSPQKCNLAESRAGKVTTPEIALPEDTHSTKQELNKEISKDYEEEHKHQWERYCNTPSCTDMDCSHRGRLCKECGQDKLDTISVPSEQKENTNENS